MITLDHVTKNYGHFALDVTMTVPEGTITAMVGPNGSGKSTTFRIILGLVAPDSGTATVLGEPAGLLDETTKRRIGAAFSDSNYPDNLNVRQVATMLAGFYPAFNADLFFSLANRMALPDKKKIKDFSTGMAAKLKVVAAVSHHPQLLVLDEPTAGLDVLARDAILDLLREFMETPGHSILVSSHNSRDIASLCDDLYLIDDGAIRLHETIDAIGSDYGVIQATRSEAATLDDEYLLARVPTLDGFRILTSQRQYYAENWPALPIDKADIDDVVALMARSERHVADSQPNS
ncbi:ABC transporter ATP-binding protein [Bifidobacterium choloepi]|uniref:ABC transporter ATP-binding protein n=1 Tax=Bifidobacterium choloepi TaxID=2614131 RepID=A0A6I5MY17_9BIFI|nr:ABC transporter ATP-binding protein [Bifidobacterium choloepi]NEG69076.1 ABC transporter ATP-binding protein [Bifidobacterium choloepi]